MPITKREFLQLSLKHKAPEYLSWHLGCLADVRSVDKRATYIGAVQKHPDGFYAVVDVNDTGLVLEKISDAKASGPLFSASDEIEVDPSWLSCIPSKMTTTFGRLIVNAVCIEGAFKGKYPYCNTHIKTADVIENLVAPLIVEDKNAKERDLRLSELVDLSDRFTFLEDLAMIVNVASNRYTITAPPTLEKERAKLKAEYGDRLREPEVYAEYQKRLQAIDDAYLAQDPSSATIITSKAKNSRKKTYLTFGKGLDFVSDSDSIILDNLIDGVNTSPDEFPKYMNDLRYASYARGHATALSGYAAKLIVRALSNIRVVDTPCSTKQGLKLTATDFVLNSLQGRQVKEGGKWVLIPNKEATLRYKDKAIELRSPMYCTSSGNTVCAACLNAAYEGRAEVATLISYELSDILNTQFMKLMHVSGDVVTRELELSDLCN